ncbi:hypothetical protein BDZ90DRAFT_279842 [Jaminaea rosea]|uniref:Uncharacterized protein n=1 Tax=Jaminaea rosea TaxID=1569628 RepID=A0A316UQE2_9BASI|nr:hypothetical protein BDZ90DRAFT_279842 [Jaminaea rosea]PWN27506.1 hypothetical protein BDZ90DRAFT_279842 [Jaminaea rosea]
MLFQTNKLQRGLSAVFIATATVAVLLVSLIPSVNGQGTQVANCYRTGDCTGANKPVYLETSDCSMFFQQHQHCAQLREYVGAAMAALLTTTAVALVLFAFAPTVNTAGEAADCFQKAGCTGDSKPLYVQARPYGLAICGSVKNVQRGDLSIGTDGCKKVDNLKSGACKSGDKLVLCTTK